jgi:stage V sporulation protein M
LVQKGTFFSLWNIHVEIEALAQSSLLSDEVRTRRESGLKFYTIKLPKFLGGIVKACLGTFTKD